MTPRMLGGATAVNVILSAAKNLVCIRGVARMPRSFAAQDDNLRNGCATVIRNPRFTR